MRRRLFLSGIAVLAGLTFGGCSTMSDPRADRGSGVIVSYVAPYDQMWATLPTVLNELGLKVASGNATDGILQVESGGGSMSWGDSATVFVERIGTKGHTRVEVVVRGALGVSLLASDLPKQIHDKLALHFRRL